MNMSKEDQISVAFFYIPKDSEDGKFFWNYSMSPEIYKKNKAAILKAQQTTCNKDDLIDNLEKDGAFLNSQENGEAGMIWSATSDDISAFEKDVREIHFYYKSGELVQTKSYFGAQETLQENAGLSFGKREFAYKLTG